MRLAWAVAALAAFAAGAQAQENVAATQVPPSACAVFTPAPSPPDGASATADQIREAVTGYEQWQAATQATLDCRATEVRALNAQAEARRNEFIAAQTDNQTRAAAFQAQLDIFSARQGRRR